MNRYSKQPLRKPDDLKTAFAAVSPETATTATRVKDTLCIGYDDAGGDEQEDGVNNDVDVDHDYITLRLLLLLSFASSAITQLARCAIKILPSFHRFNFFY